MVRFWTPTGLDVSLGIMTERYDATEVLAELARAHREGDQRPGQDRLTLIHPDIDTGTISVADLCRIQRASASYDRGAKSAAAPRSVFVAGQGRHRRGLDLYLELWNHMPGPRPEFHLCDSLDEAARLLGACGLPRHFDGLLAAEPFLATG